MQLLLAITCLISVEADGQETASPIIKSNNMQVPAFDKQGHRGCRGLMPENTIPAMLHALELGVTTLEMDIVYTQDSMPVLSHEPFFNHEITTLPDGSFIPEQDEKNHNIFRMTYAETQQYDVGLKPHPRFPKQQKMAVHKPTLAAVFDSVTAWCNQHTQPLPFFNIETKTTPLTDHLYHPAPAAFVEGLMRVIREKGMEKKIIIQSFDIRTLQYLHQHYPGIPAALLVEDFDHRPFHEQINRLGFVPAVYSPHYSLVNAGLVQACQQHTIRLIPWTVNEKEKMNSLTAIGVDGVITDYPDLFSR